MTGDELVAAAGRLVLAWRAAADATEGSSASWAGNEPEVLRECAAELDSLLAGAVWG